MTVTAPPERPIGTSENSGTVPESSNSAKALHNSFLLSPAIDLFFIINLTWPFIFLIDAVGGETVHGSMLFWQVYFVTAPHRWITLFLVMFDRQRTSGREKSFLVIGGLIVAACLSLKLGTSSLLCLGVIDYLWNAWHFASQHHGIFRLYQRKAHVNLSPTSALVEKFLFRGFLLYVIARVAGVGWEFSEYSPDWDLSQVDPVMAGIPLFLLVMAGIRTRFARSSLPGLMYFASVSLMFLSLLYAAHLERRQLVIQLSLASAVFHSIEYMAIVMWSSTTPKYRERHDVMGNLARSWLSFLTFFILFLGVTNYLIAEGYEETWILINLIVAFLHYAFDGMIWKSRKKKRAEGQHV